MKQATFSIDSLPNTYPGYTLGDHWNGFECPYFEFETAVDILQDSTVNNYRYRYNVTEDTFYVVSEEYDGSCCWQYAERFTGQMIDGVKVYGIGAYSWIWQDENDDIDPVLWNRARLFEERDRIARHTESVHTAVRELNRQKRFHNELWWLAGLEAIVQHHEQQCAIAEYRLWCLLNNLEYGAPILYESM